MVLELPIQSESTGVAGGNETPTCIVQYLLFPPHSTSTKDSFSTDDDNDAEVEALEGDSELNLVTEVWVEPQCGRVGLGPEGCRHLRGLTYPEIPRALFPRDVACVGSMLSFEYLSHLCQSKEWSPPPSEPRAPDGQCSCVHEIPFRFDLMQLLLHCQRMQTSFVLLTRETEGPSSEAHCPANDTLLGLLHRCLGQELSDRELPLSAAEQKTFLSQVLQWGAPSPGSALLTSTQLPLETSPPQWRCYGRLVTPQHVLLTFLPSTLTDVQRLVACGLGRPLQEEMRPALGEWNAISSPEDLGGVGQKDTKAIIPALSVTPANDQAKDQRELTPPSGKDPQAWPGRQSSQTECGEGPRTRCPVYVYSCSLDALREQVVSTQPCRSPQELTLTSQFLEHPSPTSAWLDPKFKEVADHCALLQEHAQRCYVRGLFRSLQQAHAVSSQDLLVAVDACEELLQEIDITSFLLALCGHAHGLPQGPGSYSLEESSEPRDKAALASELSAEAEDYSEPEAQRTQGPGIPGPELLLSEVCQLSDGVHSRLHSIIQEKFLEISRLHFRTVPSNPHYFFYCPPSSKREDESSRDTLDRKVSDLELSEAEPIGDEGEVSGGCIATESDPELEVEYRDSRDPEGEPPDSTSLSDEDTMNPDEDSFSVLGDDANPEGTAHDLPPLFLHLTCSVRLRGQHNSVPVHTLPTCLGQVLSFLESPPSGGRLALLDLSVTLDVFILTLPLEVELPPPSDPQHHRSVSESSTSFPRSPGRPSSFRSDDSLGPSLPPPEIERQPGLSSLPLPHRQAIETTMSEIRWLLEDEMVGALRQGGAPSSSSLQRVAAHIHASPGRSTCLRQTLPLSFVFGPERSLARFKEEFCRLHLPGHSLCQDSASGCFFVSVSPSSCEESPTPWAWLSREDQVAHSGPTEALPTSPQVPGSPDDTEGSTLGGSTLSALSRNHPGPSRGQSVVSSQGSVDSDQLGYDGGSSSGSENEGPTVTPGEKVVPTLKEPSGLLPTNPLELRLPDFWLLVRVMQDRVEVYAHARSLGRDEGGPGAECRHLQQLLAKKVGEICREVNQRLLLQDLHDSHVCNSLLVAESEEDLWRSETPFHPRQRALLPSDDYAADESCPPRGYLAATMQFVPGHFSCNVVWGTVIRVHSRLKMGPSMGVSRAIQALRSVLNAFSVVNRKNMFVYQERATRAVYYLRLVETSCSEKLLDGDALPPSLALSRSQEPICPEEASGPRSPLDVASSRSSETARPVGQVDRHIQLLVHGVGQAGPEITEELVRALHRRLDEATLDIITVMLVRNCKLTPADVEFIQPPGSPPSEVLHLVLPPACRPWLPALAWYLRQNLLIFLHSPKYTDSNSRHHFQHPFHPPSGLPDSDIYLYNKPGGQGTGGKGVACIALSFMDEGGTPISLGLWPPVSLGSLDLLQDTEFESLTRVTCCPTPAHSTAGQVLQLRLDIWEKGNISRLQLEEKLRGATRHALADAVMELQLLPAPLCVEEALPGMLFASLEAKSRGDPSSTSPLPFPPVPSSGEPVTPPSKMGRRSFWDMLSKAECGDLGSPKTTDDIVLERSEETRGRRRHKTESIRPPGGPERTPAPEMSAQGHRRRATQLEEGEAGLLHPGLTRVAQRWMEFMAQIGCPSVSGSSTHMVSRFLLPSVLTETISLVASLAGDTSIRMFEQQPGPDPVSFTPCSTAQLHPPPRPGAERHLLLLGRNFSQWRRPTQQAPKAMQRFEPGVEGSGRDAPRQRLLLLHVMDTKLQLLTYNWAPDLGGALSRALGRLLQWQNARAHLVHCLLSQKLGLFHHYGHLDCPGHDDKEPNPFLTPSLEAETLIRSPGPPPSREQGRLSGSSRGGAGLTPETMPFDEALRDIAAARPGPAPRPPDPVTYHGQQFLEIKTAERRELERQMKMENLFVTWQQRSAQSNMPISAGELETLKQSSRLVHYCATALLFDPASWQHGSPESTVLPEGKRRHRSNESGGGGREPAPSCEVGELPTPGAREEPWLRELSSTFLLQYVQYLQSTGFILVQLRPPSPTRSTSRPRAMAILGTEGRGSFSCPKTKIDGSPKSASSPITTYHLQRALPGGIVLMELTFQGCYFCVKQYALECSRIPMGQAVNSQLSMLFTEECDKVRDLMHVHSFSYDFHLRLAHQHVLGSHMALRQGYHLTSFLRCFLSHHPDGPNFGRNHIYQGTMELPTQLIAAHQLYNYVADHASTYNLKPLRMARPGGGPEHNEYALVSVWNSPGIYQDSEGLRHQDDFDVSLLVCHCAAPFEEQGEAERHMLRLQFFVVLTSQRELFPRLTADMRRFRKSPRLASEPEGASGSRGGPSEVGGASQGSGPTPELGSAAPLFPPLAAEVAVARALLAQLVQQAGSHCRRDTLWKRLFLLEPPGADRLRLGGRLALGELEELLGAVHAKSIGDIDPQLDCFLSMTVSWYQSLVKVLLSRFPQSCRHFQSPDSGTQYLVVLNQKFTDCFVLVFLDSHSGKTSLTVVFREPFPVQPQNSESPPAQLVSTYHHLESVINTACFTLWTRLL
uniref:SZT2 subunit of KICSTOR complex n=1 Tax=Monodelphis domestica TaxID=13616 RepID=F6WZE5_MONDO